jgi:hypothetical protein
VASLYEDLFSKFEKAQESARLSNLARKDQISAIFDEIIRRYEPGGSFGRGYLAQLEKTKVRDVSKAEQRDISSGLFGLRDRGAEWESATGAEARLKLEDLMMERLSGAQMGKASFLEGIEEPYPDMSALMQAMAAGGGGGSVGGQMPVRGESMTSKLAAARASNWAFGGLGGGGTTGGMGTTGVTRPTTSTGGTTGGGIGVYGLSTTGDPLAHAGKSTMTPPAGGISYEQAMAGRKGKTYEEAMAGPGSLQESVFAEKPPRWTGNYRSWKKKMDDYNRRHGKPTTGY